MPLSVAYWSGDLPDPDMVPWYNDGARIDSRHPNDRLVRRRIASTGTPETTIFHGAHARLFRRAARLRRRRRDGGVDPVSPRPGAVSDTPCGDRERDGEIPPEVTQPVNVLREPPPLARAILWKPLPDAYHLLASMMRGARAPGVALRHAARLPSGRAPPTVRAGPGAWRLPCRPALRMPTHTRALRRREHRGAVRGRERSRDRVARYAGGFRYGSQATQPASAVAHWVVSERQRPRPAAAAGRRRDAHDVLRRAVADDDDRRAIVDELERCLLHL